MGIELTEDHMVFLVMMGVTLLALSPLILEWGGFLLTGSTSKKPDYHTKTFWEKRYIAHPDTYEWFCTYDDLEAAKFMGAQVRRALSLPDGFYSRQLDDRY